MCRGKYLPIINRVINLIIVTIKKSSTEDFFIVIFFYTCLNLSPISGIADVRERII